MPSRNRWRGFTLVELLVALLILGIVAAMAWKGVDGIVRARDASEDNLGRTLRLQSVMAQWDADLRNLQDGGGIVPVLQFDGANLRLTRRTPRGLELVVWSLRGGAWTRWTSEPVTQKRALQEAWLRSLQLVGNEPGQLRALSGIADWQLYFWRGNSWSNAQSSSGAPTPGGGLVRGGTEPAPEGVRLVLTFAQGSGYTGSLTRDLRVEP